MLYRLSQQGNSVKPEEQESQITAATKALEERQELEKDTEVKKVLDRLEKEWAKEERKKSLITGEKILPNSKMPVKTESKTTTPGKTPELKNTISM